MISTLDGTAIPVDLGSGVTLRAPGLRGTAELEPQLFGGRADEPPLATPALAEAIAAAGMEQVHGVQIAATEVPVTGLDIRGPADEGQLVLQVPNLGARSPQVLLLVDEAGVATWHFPEPTGPSAADPLEFTVTRAVATTPIEGAQPEADRGLVAVIGRKLLSVLVFPVVEAAVGAVARVIAERFESSSRPYRWRRFAPGETRVEGAGDLAKTGWGGVSDDRALLFIHGTFSTSHGGFSGLPDAAVAKLWNAYGGRVYAFDHPTLSATPAENVAKLLTMIPTGRSIPVDIVAHSRGGLVARTLADAVAGLANPPIRVRSTVFVASPNAGTALADDKNIKAFIDRMTTMLNLVPDGPWSVVTDVLSGVLEVVKIVAAAVVNKLPGLQAMDPNDSVLKALGGTADPALPRYAIDAEYEPTGSLLRLSRGADLAVDLVFGNAANDFVVPTSGAAGPTGVPGFPVPAQRRLSFGPADGVWHCSFFSQPKTIAKLEEWCRPDA